MTRHDFVRRRAALIIVAAVAFLPAIRGEAQTDSGAPAPPPADTLAAATSDGTPREWMNNALPASEEEKYLRYLQVAGLVRVYPWTVRTFSDNELRSLSAVAATHPWSGSATFTSTQPLARMIPLRGEVRYNSGFPHGSNDAAVWAGRGMTASAIGGIAVANRFISLKAAPIAFIAQNSSFPLMDNGLSGNLRFADGQFGAMVDRPQRFGDERYARIDPGQSSARLTLGPVAGGVATENLLWGPLDEYPFTLGANAPGFPHAFFGTSRPVNLFVAHLHGRVIWGTLEQSSYSPVTGSETFQSVEEPGTRRFASGFALTLQPRGVEGLEFGFTRFLHTSWPESGLPSSYFSKPFSRLFSNRIRPVPELDEGRDFDNQLFSIFARWLFPAARLEVYGEYGRDDHSADARDFLQEPDHARSYGLGLRYVARATADRLDGLTIELINFQLPHLARTLRGEGEIYAHGLLRQGHTHRGQLLGADVGVGAAAGFTARWDAYRPSGRRSIAARRIVRQDRGTFYQTGVVDTRPSDVLLSLELELARRIRWTELTGGAAMMRNLNRNFSDGAWNVSTFIRAQVPLLPRIQ